MLAFFLLVTIIVQVKTPAGHLYLKTSCYSCSGINLHCLGLDINMYRASNSNGFLPHVDADDCCAVTCGRFGKTCACCVCSDHAHNYGPHILHSSKLPSKIEAFFYMRSCVTPVNQLPY